MFMILPAFSLFPIIHPRTRVLRLVSLMISSLLSCHGCLQISDTRKQSVLFFRQLGVEVLVAAQLHAVVGCLAENVDFRCSLLVLERRDLTLELFEEILESDSSLAFHVVVQVTLLDGLGFVGIDRLLKFHCHPLLLTVAVLLVTVVRVVVAVLALSVTAGRVDVAVGSLRAVLHGRRALTRQRRRRR